jgi:hypothetical protein
VASCSEPGQNAIEVMASMLSRVLVEGKSALGSHG